MKRAAHGRIVRRKREGKDRKKYLRSYAQQYREKRRGRGLFVGPFSIEAISAFMHVLYNACSVTGLELLC